MAIRSITQLVLVHPSTFLHVLRKGCFVIHSAVCSFHLESSLHFEIAHASNMVRKVPLFSFELVSLSNRFNSCSPRDQLAMDALDSYFPRMRDDDAGSA